MNTNQSQGGWRLWLDRYAPAPASVCVFRAYCDEGVFD